MPARDRLINELKKPTTGVTGYDIEWHQHLIRTNKIFIVCVEDPKIVDDSVIRRISDF